MSRHWCFTSFLDAWPQWVPEKMRYLVYQREVAPDTGKQHWQGYVEFLGNSRMKGGQRLLGLPGAHMEVRSGTREQARDYCMKLDTQIMGPYVYGDWVKGQGERTDLKAVAQLVVDGASNRDIAESDPVAYIRYHRGIAALKLAVAGKRDCKPHVTVYWGPTGTGKSLLAEADTKDPFWYSSEKGWWDGYDGHEEVILDDFRPRWWSADYMLRLLDRYPMRVEFKGGSAEFVARKIVITSNVDPRDWYPHDTDAIMRRLDYVENIV